MMEHVFMLSFFTTVRLSALMTAMVMLFVMNWKSQDVQIQLLLTSTIATNDNGNCIYIIYGCTNENACNYNIDATNDDASCIFSEIIMIVMGTV